MKMLTANGGTASVNQSPMAKNNTKSTYTCVVVNEGSFNKNVRISAPINESRKYRIDLLEPAFAFGFADMVMKLVCYKCRVLIVGRDE